MNDVAEQGRLRALRSTELLDSEPERAFDRLTRLAAGLLDAPVALVSLVDERRQFFKSAVGLAEPWASRRETPLTHSFCKLAVGERARLVVADAREDPRLRDNLAIRDLAVIAYAGVPLVVDDEAIGAFCVIDDKPRVWSDAELALLDDLADSVVSEIELRLALRASADQRALTDALLESLGEGVLAMDADRTFLIANRAARDLFPEGPEVGKPVPADWGRRHRSLRVDGTPLPPEDGALARGLRGERTDSLVCAVHGGQGEPVWVEASGRAVRDAGGRVVASIAVYRDVTERRREAESLKRAHDLLARERALLGATLQSIDDGVALFDGAGRMLLANPAYVAMFGLSPEHLAGTTRETLRAHFKSLVDEPEEFAARLSRQAEGSGEDYVMARPQRRVLRRTKTPLKLPAGDCWLVTWHDVTAERALLAERERQLLVDSLTGIANRRAAEVGMAVEDARRRRGGTPLSVALFDVDHFKRVNDEHGHAAGDDVLRRVAATIAEQARVTDLVARWGGEEFVAVLAAPLAGALSFGERVRQAVAAMPFPDVDRVTISAGVAELGATETPAEALSRADALLYDAKRGGRNRVVA